MKKHNPLIKEGVAKYVKVMKGIYTAFCIVMIPSIMIFLVMALSGYNLPLTIPLTVVLVLLFFVGYGFYAMNVTLGTVLAVQCTDQVVYLTTKRKTFTYDVKDGCVFVKITPRKYVCTFRTQDSQDNFIFYRHVWFTPYSEEQFTESEIRAFCPDFDEYLYQN